MHYENSQRLTRDSENAAPVNEGPNGRTGECGTGRAAVAIVPYKGIPRGFA